MKIFCFIDMFAAKQSIYKVDDKGDMEKVATTKTNIVAETLLRTCTHFKLNTIHICGPEEYVKQIAAEIKTIPEYSIFNIKVEVN